MITGFRLVSPHAKCHVLPVVKRPVPQGQCRAFAGVPFHFMLLIASTVAAVSCFGAEQTSSNSAIRNPEIVVSEYCFDCHDSEAKKGGLDLERISRDDVEQHPAEWEKVIRKLRSRQMPPIGKERPPDKTYDELVAKLAVSLDRAAAKNPAPGRTETFRRLNRTEYQNAIRDLLALDIDAATLLPKD